MSDQYTITLKRNNDRNFPIVVTKDDSPVNITDWEIKMAVKANQDDPDADAIIDVDGVVANASAGEAMITISASDTALQAIGEYYYDILLLDDQGKRQSSKTGIFKLVQEITDGN